MTGPKEVSLQTLVAVAGEACMRKGSYKSRQVGEQKAPRGGCWSCGTRPLASGLSRQDKKGEGTEQAGSALPEQTQWTRALLVIRS